MKVEKPIETEKTTESETPIEKQTETPKACFKDIAKGQNYYDAVMWAVENGITSGTDTNTFSPAKNCTRSQLVTFLYRFINTKT